MSENCLLDGPSGQQDFGPIEPEDDLDAFNDETFGDGLGDAWQEDAHEKLAQMTEQERLALKQSNEFFDFGSDGEELGGELEDALEPTPKLNGSSHGMLERLDQLSLHGGVIPPPPLTVQTNQPQMLPIQSNFQTGHHQIPGGMYLQAQQQMVSQHPQFPLLPPSHFAPPNTHFQDPAIMSLAKMPPPHQFIQQPYSHTQIPQQMPHHIQQPSTAAAAARSNAFSPPTVPGMKSLAEIEAEMMFGSRPSGPPPNLVPQPVAAPTPIYNERSGQMGHINPAIHNLNYPGMRDRHNHPIQQQQQTQNQPPVTHFRNSPVSNINQGYQNQQQLHHQNRNNNNINKSAPVARNQAEVVTGRVFQEPDRRNDHYHEKRNDHFRGDDRRHDQYNERRNDHFYDRRNNDHYDKRDKDNHYNRHYDNRNSYNEETFGPSARQYRDNHDQATRRDLMPGHVHTLGILRHSRSRHDRNNAETFGEEGELDNDSMLINPTGDPLLDAKMLEEQEEMARRRKHYASNEDEYAGLMSQRDKQWIINIQLNQLKCDNPYVDDYYYTMYEAKRRAENDESKAGGQLLLNESMDHSSYTPTQFENSLGKLQVVTVKAPRQIIDVGVVRCADSPVSHLKTETVHEGSPAPGAVVVEQGNKKQGNDYKQVLIQIEGLYMALLDLESDQLKLSALPTNAPLREQVSSDEIFHLQTLQSGLKSTEWLADCLAVPKGRSLVLRSLTHLSPDRRAVTLTSLLSNIHLLCKGDKEDHKYWNVLAQHIALESHLNLEPCVEVILALKKKVLMSLLTTSLGSSVILTLILKASLLKEAGVLWSKLASTLLSCVSDGVKLGGFLVKFTLSESTLDRLLTLDSGQKSSWVKIMALSSAMDSVPHPS